MRHILLIFIAFAIFLFMFSSIGVVQCQEDNMEENLPEGIHVEYREWAAMYVDDDNERQYKIADHKLYCYDIAEEGESCIKGYYGDWDRCRPTSLLRLPSKFGVCYGNNKCVCENNTSNCQCRQWIYKVPRKL